MTKTIVVTGATGIQGGSVVNQFLNLPGWKVRGITRNPDSAAAQALTLRGVQVFKANLDDVPSLTDAFRGANVIFLVTDYWSAVNVPENYAKAAAQGKPIRDLAFDLEIAQGVNAANAAVDPLVLPTLEHFIFSSLADMRKWTNGKMSFKNHFESEGKIEEHILGLPELSGKLSTVQLGYYYTNWKQSPDYAPKKLEDDSFLYRTPFGADTKMPWVDASGDTGKFVEALVNAPAGTHMLGVSEFGTYTDLMAAFGDVLEVKTNVENVNVHEFFAAAPLPDDLRPVLVQLVSFMDQYGWTGGDPRIKLPQEVDPAIRTTTIREYVEGEDWSSVL